MASVTGQLLKMILGIVYFFLKILGFAIGPMILMIMLFILYWMVKGYRPIKSSSKYKKDNFFKKLLWDFPKQFALDLLSRNPNDYPYYGSLFFCGSQGCGKTISMVYYLQKIQKKYPLSQAYANFDIKGVPQFNGWMDIVEKNNNELGITFAIDELTIWFNNKDSRDFPPSLLQDLNQQRKQRKMTIGTAQRFGLLAKDLRALPEYVYLPHTIFSCLTFVLVARPETWNDEKNCFTKYEFGKTWFFIHTPELRKSYDTYQRILRESKNGYAPNRFLNPGVVSSETPPVSS